jgi:hypothetical protein
MGMAQKAPLERAGHSFAKQIFADTQTSVRTLNGSITQRPAAVVRLIIISLINYKFRAEYPVVERSRNDRI